MATEEEVLKKMRTWILEEKKSIGVKFLLRNTKLNAKEISSVLNRFYKSEKGNSVGISASYVVIGKARGKASTSADKDAQLILKSTICTENRLDDVCKTFVEVHHKSIFTIQKGVLCNLHQPLNNIYAGKIPAPVIGIEDRLNIIDEEVIADINSVKELRKVNVHHNELPEFQTRVKRGPKVFIKKIVVKRDQHSLQEAFAKGEKLKEEEEEMEVVEDIQLEASPSVKRPAKAEETSTKAKKAVEAKPEKQNTVKKDSKKQGKLMFGEMKLETHRDKNLHAPIIINSALGSEEEEVIPIKKQKKCDDFDDDLFSTEDDVKGSVLHDEELPSSKTKPMDHYEPPKARRRIVESDSEEEQMQLDDSHTEENRELKEFKPVKYKKTEITEQFVDEEGMTVTRVITKLLKEEVDQSDIMPTSSRKKPVLKTSNTTIRGPKKAPADQPTITTFFTKK